MCSQQAYTKPLKIATWLSNCHMVVTHNLLNCNKPVESGVDKMRARTAGADGGRGRRTRTADADGGRVFVSTIDNIVVIIIIIY